MGNISIPSVKPIKVKEVISDATKEKWKAKIEAIVGAAKDKQIELNEWETDFIKNVSRLDKDLSWKQSQALNKIYKRVG